MGEFEALEATERFDDAYADLEPAQQRQCDKAVRLLLEDPSHPGLGFKPIEPAKIYYEARINRRDRLIVRPEGDTAWLLDVVEHDDIGRYGKA